MAEGGGDGPGDLRHEVGSDPDGGHEGREGGGQRDGLGAKNKNKNAPSASMANGTEEGGGRAENGEESENGNLATPPPDATGGARPKVRSQGDGTTAETADSSDSDLPALSNGQRAGASNPDSDADNDDFYVYTYTGSRRRRRRSGGAAGGANGAGAFSSADYLSADLPKSFYQDTGSESEGGGAGSVPGVSGAGQSNLSTEVAALLQSELASSLHVSSREQSAHQATRGPGRRQRRRRKNNNSSSSNNGAQNGAAGNDGLPNGAESPDEMDFLEMDFVDSGDDGDSDDSGQGGDENVTETNEEDSEADAAVVELPDGTGAAGGQPERDNNPWGASTPPLPASSRRLDLHEARVPDTLSFDLPERGEKPKGSAASAAPPTEVPSNSGVTSAPAVTPVREDLSLMVRSRSLNSPLASRTAAGGARDCPALMARGESDPTVSGSSAAGRRGGMRDPRRSSFDPLVNMEVCGTRLSQREALLFQVPPPSPVGEEAAALVRHTQAGEQNSSRNKVAPFLL